SPWRPCGRRAGGHRPRKRFGPSPTMGPPGAGRLASGPRRDGRAAANFRWMLPASELGPELRDAFFEPLADEPVERLERHVAEQTWHVQIEARLVGERARPLAVG